LRLKAVIPWPIKFGSKALIGLCRIDYRWLKRAGIVEFGRMEDVIFAADVFQRHVRTPYESQSLPLPGGTLLELGPGDSVTTGFIGRASQFQEVILVDAGSFADLRPAALTKLRGELLRAGLPVADLTADAAEQLPGLGIQYLTQGNRSLQSLAPGTVTHSFSNTVLQHVYRDELPELVRQLGRVHAVRTLSAHTINFTDHFSGGGFVNHKLPDWLMESWPVKHGNLYTNRVSLAQYCELFSAAHFALQSARVEFSDCPAGVAFEYQSWETMGRDAESRRARGAFVLLQKR
jgi:hypothetical protein